MAARTADDQPLPHADAIDADAVTQRQARTAFVGLAAVAFVGLVALGFGMTFFADEWAFIEGRSLGDSSTWLPPHNEHWATIPVLVYRGLVETIGIGSYVPYQALVVALHIGVAAAVYLLIERRSGPLIALAASVIVLVFGSGFENLYWGFQIGFVGSLLLGLLALLLTDAPPTARRAIGVTALLLASMATQGIGLVMAVAVGIEWLLDPRWRRWVPLLLVPAAVYLGWYVAYGQAGIEAHRNPFTLDALIDVPGFVARGIGNAIGSVTGLAGPLAPVGAALLALVLMRTDGRGQSFARAIALLVAIGSMYALIGLVRAHLFEGQANYTRYTYVSGILLLIAISAAVGAVRVPSAPGLRRTAVVGGFGAWFALAVAFNLALLVGGRELFLERADMTRALVTVALDRSPPPGAQLDRSLVLVPSATSLHRISATYGDPRNDDLVPWAVRDIPDGVLREATRRLVEGAPIPGAEESGQAP